MFQAKVLKISKTIPVKFSCFTDEKISMCCMGLFKMKWTKFSGKINKDQLVIYL